MPVSSLTAGLLELVYRRYAAGNTGIVPRGGRRYSALPVSAGSIARLVATARSRWRFDDMLRVHAITVTPESAPPGNTLDSQRYHRRQVVTPRLERWSLVDGSDCRFVGRQALPGAITLLR